MLVRWKNNVMLGIISLFMEAVSVPTPRYPLGLNSVDQGVSDSHMAQSMKTTKRYSLSRRNQHLTSRPDPDWSPTMQRKHWSRIFGKSAVFDPETGEAYYVCYQKGQRRTKIMTKLLKDFNNCVPKLRADRRHEDKISHASRLYDVNQEIRQRCSRPNETPTQTFGSTILNCVTFTSSDSAATSSSSDTEDQPSSSTFDTDGYQFSQWVCDDYDPTLTSIKRTVVRRMVEVIYDTGGVTNMRSSCPPQDTIQRVLGGPSSIGGIGGSIDIKEFFDQEYIAKAESGEEYHFTLPKVAWAPQMPVNLISGGAMSELGWKAVISWVESSNRLSLLASL